MTPLELLEQTEQYFNKEKPVTRSEATTPAPTENDLNAAFDPVIENWHKRQYEAALACAEVKGPAWSDLTEDQRANIRTVNQKHHQFMQSLGKSIADGTPLPPVPFGDQ